MLLGLLFVLGIANIAAGRAVLASGHPAVATLPRAFRAGGGRLAIFAEFCVLLAAMLSAANGVEAAAWIYALYSLASLVAARAILAGKW